MRGKTIDLVRGINDWPVRYNIRTMRSETTDRWHGREDELRAAAKTEMERYAQAAAAGDATIVSPLVGEAVGLIHDVRPAAKILADIVREAETILQKAPAWVVR